MQVTVLISAAGVNRTLLRRLLGGWAFALAFQLEVFASLGVCYTAATSLPPSRRCPQNGALLDELKLAGGTLRKTLRHTRISKWRWRLHHVHYTGGLARLVRFGREEWGACSP